MWSSIKGHKKEIERLQIAAEKQQLAHAYLFTGMDGVGKRLVAKTFATALMCEKGARLTCGTCQACRSAESGNHPDLISLTVDEGKTQIRIDQVRDIQRRLIHSPFSGHYQVVIVDEADRLNEEASNAILKTLEEPIKGTLFFLITARPHMLLPTVRSRCQEIRFAPLDTKTIASHLQEHLSLAPDESLLIAQLSQGSLAKAMSFPAEELRETNERILGLLKNFSAEMVLATAEDWAKDLNTAAVVIQVLSGWFRDILILKTTEDEGAVLNSKYLGEIKKLASNFTIDRLQTILANIREAEKALDTTYNKQLMFEQLLFSL